MKNLANRCEMLMRREKFNISAFLAGSILYTPISLTILPIFDGWFNTPLGDSNRLPYKDYYFPTPPLTYFEAQFFEIFPTSGLALRLFAILLYGFFTLSLYSISNKYIDRTRSLWIAIFCTSILINLKLEAPGGWNTQSAILTTIGFSLFLQQWRNFTNNKSHLKPSFHRGILIGLFFFMSSCVKQTTFIAQSFLLLAAYILSTTQGNTKRKKLILSVILTQLITGCFLLAYLHLNGTLKYFLTQTLSSGNKKFDVSRLILNVFSEYHRSITNEFTLALLVFIIVVEINKKLNQPTNLHGFYKYYVTVISTVIFTEFDLLQKFLIVITTIAISKLCNRLIGEKYRSGWEKIILMFAPIVFQYIELRNNASFVNSSNFQVLKIYIIKLDHILQKHWIIFCLCAIVFAVFQRYRHKSEHSLEILLVAVFSFAGMFMGSLSSGGDFYLFWFIPMLAVIISVLINSVTEINATVLRFFIFFVVSMSFFTFTTNTLRTPYDWWLWKEPQRISTDYQFLESGYYKGLLVRGVQVDFYNRVNSAEERALGLSKIKEKTIFSFPNINYVESLISNTRYRKLRCPSLWFDLCPNDLAKGDLIRFRTDPPAVVVWADLPPESFKVHENVFLQGKSSLREWDTYRNLQVRSGAWQIVDIIPANSKHLNSTPVTIYSIQE